MAEFALVMPMAGRGSRFANGGASVPKPLQQLWGRPFYWWAVESARRAFQPVETIFVILREHDEQFALGLRTTDDLRDARFAVIDAVTCGAAETAKIAVEQLDHRGPLVVNDTDHAFACAPELTASLAEEPRSALLTFEADSPSYSYAPFGPGGRVAGTDEKEVVSSDATPGAYVFASPSDFLEAYAGYEGECRYAETFVSGLFDRLIVHQRPVSAHRLEAHLSFGTPEELQALAPTPTSPWASWL